MPERVQLRRTKGWRKPEGAIVVARPTRWGNPFRVSHGSVYGPSWQVARQSWRPVRPDGEWSVYSTHAPASAAVEHAVELFRMLLKVRGRDEPERLREWLAPLVGHDLCCWCLVGEPCHADVLLESARLRELRTPGTLWDAS